VAPIFLCAEIFFALGLRPGLRSAVQARAMKSASSPSDANLTPAD
jgi:uncharacterized membrane protein YGL010W